MAYYVAYKSMVRKRITEAGKIQHYVTVGVVYDRTTLHEIGAIEWTQHDTEVDASRAWEAHCHHLGRQWPRGCGMDKAQAEKYSQVSCGNVTIDGSWMVSDQQGNEPPTLF